MSIIDERITFSPLIEARIESLISTSTTIAEIERTYRF